MRVGQMAAMLATVVRLPLTAGQNRGNAVTGFGIVSKFVPQTSPSEI
jgi:hypothetical protein